MIFIFLSFFKTYAGNLPKLQAAYDALVEGHSDEEDSGLAGAISGKSNDQQLLNSVENEEEDMGTKVCEVIWQNAQKESWREKCGAMATLYPLFFIIILCYTTTLSSFPGLSFDGKVQPEMSKGGSSLVILIYNLGDFGGKLAYGFFPIKDNIGTLFYTIIRAVVINFAYYLMVTQAFDDAMYKWWVNYLLLAMLALTNGHLTSACFSLAPARVEDRLKKYSGFIMTMGLLLGLWYGSFVGWIITLGFETPVLF